MFEEYDFEIIRKGEYRLSRVESASLYSVPGTLSYGCHRDYLCRD